MRWTGIPIALFVGIALGADVGFGDDDAKQAIDAVLDDFHDAAAKADGARYFGHMTADGVFLGTDATERWTKPEFETFAKPYFEQGQGWAYTSEVRRVDVESAGDMAWFDELLHNEHYGTCRGSGVLRREDGRWRIAQYNLSIPIPNDLAKDVVAAIRGTTDLVAAPTLVYVVRCAEARSTGADPLLSAEGLARAERLAAMLRSAGVTCLYTTGLARSRQTVAPLAERLGIEATVYARGATQALAAAIRDGKVGPRVVVSAHRDTVPRLLEDLGVQKRIEVGEAEHDALHVVTLLAEGHASLYTLRIAD